jgi:hypothetical protein
MSTPGPTWTDTLIHLLALAARLEGEGQYNVAKLLRAGADGLARQAASQLALSGNRADLADEVEQAASALAGQGADETLLAALRRGAAAVATGRLPMLYETPHPYVCRTCGHVALGGVTGKCPGCGAWAATFQWFPPVYWLEGLEPPAALEMLSQTPREVALLLEGLAEERMTRPPAEGGWTIRSAVAHLRDAQDVLAYRLELFLQEDHPRLESKAVFEWATQEEERPPSTMDIFAAYNTSRAQTLARLEGLPLEAWWRTGEHEEFGPISLRQHVSYFACHELTHLPQLSRMCGRD